MNDIIAKLRKITPLLCIKCKEIVKDHLVSKLKIDKTLEIIDEWNKITPNCQSCKDCINMLKNLLIKILSKGKEDEYQQEETIHCPIPECKGMLLTSPFKHELKCSVCSKYFMESIEYKEVKSITK